MKQSKTWDRIQVISSNNNTAWIPYSNNHRVQLDEWEERRGLVHELSDLLRISNTRREEFKEDLRDLIARYKST